MELVAGRRREQYREVEYDDTNIYEDWEQLLENDEIEAFEAGFMAGYNQAN